VFSNTQNAQNSFLGIATVLERSITANLNSYAVRELQSAALWDRFRDKLRAAYLWVFFMLIPNAENAIVDVRKLRDYCLNLNHEYGQHKARLFSSILGMTAAQATELRQILLEKVRVQEANLGRRDEFGQRYTLDFTVEWQNKRATLRSAWIIEHDSTIPKLTTCYPL
jgi:hypothetical protein